MQPSNSLMVGNVDNKQTKEIIKEKIILKRWRAGNVPLEYIYDVGLRKKRLSTEQWLKDVKVVYGVKRSSAYQWAKVAELIEKDSQGRYRSILKTNTSVIKDYNYSQLSKLLDLYKKSSLVKLACEKGLYNACMTAEEIETKFLEEKYKK